MHYTIRLFRNIKLIPAIRFKYNLFQFEDVVLGYTKFVINSFVFIGRTSILAVDPYSNSGLPLAMEIASSMSFARI